MSLSNIIAGAAREAEGVFTALLDDAGFTLAGKRYAGTPSTESQGQTLEVGGRLVTLAKTITATRVQFSAEPIIGSAVVHDGRTYKLIKLSRDSSIYQLWLEHANQ